MNTKGNLGGKKSNVQPQAGCESLALELREFTGEYYANEFQVCGVNAS
jgi:hypothetical protein